MRATLAAVVALTPSLARAQGGDSATAQVLFDQAKTLMDHGKFAEACPKLAESQRLDPGGGTLIFLGTCYEKDGKLASAWATFREAIDVAQRDRRTDRASFAKKHVADLEGKVAHLTIVVAKPIEGLEVRRDDVVIARPSWGESVPADAGAHSIAASAPGFKPWSSTISIDRDGASLTVTVPELAREEAPHVEPAKPPPPPPEPKRTWQRPVGIALAAGGVAGGVLGAVLGLAAKSKHDSAKALCTLGPTHDGCTADAVSAESSARGLGDASTIAFVAGGVLLAGGLTLWLTAPSAAPSKEARVKLELGPASARVLGAF